MLERLLKHDILANLFFGLVLFVGLISYLEMPRERDPSVNFNWVSIFTKLPGASAAEIEKRVTEPLEDAVDKVTDVKFVSSNSRPGVSSILVRFENIEETTFHRRVADLRREIQTKAEDLPVDATRPDIIEITSANAFPTAIVVITALEGDENLRVQSRNVKRDLERLTGVERVDSAGDRDPELQVLFSPDKLVGLGVSPTDLADTVAAYFRDLAAGSVRLGDRTWLVRVAGTSSDPSHLGRLPILTAKGEVPLRSVADVVRGRADATELVHYEGKDAVMLQVYKKREANILDLVDEIKSYIAKRNLLANRSGVQLALADDQTASIQNALSVMQNNALVGLLLVLLVTWAFLGAKIAMLTSAGIPFVLAGTFWALDAIGQTLNVVVLLGIVISLGMLVDDAVVVVEAIYERIQRGAQGLKAAVGALREVFAPVTTAVLTTVAAFLPLMLLPGVLGDFMRVVPIVVTCALIISLVEAYWILPAHVIRAGVNFKASSKWHRTRERAKHWVRYKYIWMLFFALRWPKVSVAATLSLFVLSVAVVIAGVLRTDFFASDPYRIFYVNLEMPAGTSLEGTMRTLSEIERVARATMEAGEARAVLSYSGVRFMESEPLFGDQHGQIFVSLNPKAEGSRTIDAVIEAMRKPIAQVPGPAHVSFLRRSTGPPTSKPISIKVRGDDSKEIREAADLLIEVLSQIPGIKDVADDDSRGRMQLTVRLNPDAVTRAAMNPVALTRMVRLLGDGEVVASMQHLGEKLNVRVRARPEGLHDIDGFLRNVVSLPDGGEISLGQLFYHNTARSKGNIRHYNLRRAITVEADLDKSVMDTLAANRLIEEAWAQYIPRFSNVDLDFSGELDDIEESIGAIAILFLFGVGLIYVILATQFRSYVQPALVLVTVPMAFTGVVVGLLVSRNPLSMYTLYGVVALAGIAVNAAIVLISNANEHIKRGRSVFFATVYAAKRRVIPILITSLTTMAGLLSLAVGLAGKSLVWGPVATAIIWGLGVSTVMTLFVIPLLYSNLLLIKQRWKAEASKAPALTLQGAGADFTTGRWRRFLKNPFSAFGHSGQPRAVGDAKLEFLLNKGVQHLARGDYTDAIRIFERTVVKNPDCLICNTHAAQALIVLMERDGWDDGYGARAERYLQRAQRLDPDDQRVRRLALAYAQLRSGTAHEV